MSPQVRTEIEEQIAALDADNFDGVHDSYIEWLQAELDNADD